MAKTKFNIADAIKGEIKTPATVPTKEIEKEEEIAPIAKTETPSVPTVIVKEGKKRGRPRKEDGRNTFVRTIVTPGLKEKLHIICRQKNMSENDYTFEVLKKAINRDFEQAFSDMKNDIE